MNNFILLHTLDIVSELIYTVYQLGVFTRQHVLPLVVYVYVVLEYMYHQVLARIVSTNDVQLPLLTKA